jgi:hypothetical protein
MEIVVRIPVKPHLKKFLHVEWGDQMRLTKRSPLARIMFSYLGVSTRKRQLPEKLSAHYDVIVPISYFTRHKVSTITEEGMLELCLWFDEYFTRLMKEYVCSRLELKKKEVLKQLLEHNDKKTAIQVSESLADFLRKYGITEEDLPLETAQKRYLRSKNKRGILI